MRQIRLDIDRLKIVANGVNQLANPENATIPNYSPPAATNYRAGLSACDGRCTITTGGKELALEPDLWLCEG